MVLQSGHPLRWCFSCEVLWSHGLKPYSFTGSVLGSPPLGWFPWFRGVKGTGCALSLQGHIHGSAKIKACFHPRCSQDTFPSSMLGHWAEPSCSPGAGSAQHTQLCPREEGLLFTKDWWNDVKDWQKHRRKMLNYLTLPIAAVVFISWGWTRAILQSIFSMGVNPILKYHNEY